MTERGSVQKKKLVIAAESMVLVTLIFIVEGIINNRIYHSIVLLKYDIFRVITAAIVVGQIYARP